MEEEEEEEVRYGLLGCSNGKGVAEVQHGPPPSRRVKLGPFLDMFVELSFS